MVDRLPGQNRSGVFGKASGEPIGNQISFTTLTRLIDVAVDSVSGGGSIRYSLESAVDRLPIEDKESTSG